MTSRPLLLLPTVVCLLAAAMSACGEGDSDEPPEVPDDRMVVEAPIADLNLASSAGTPTQYSLAITSGLPNACAKFHDARITSASGTLITVAVTNTVPKDPNVACAEVYGEHTSILQLGSDFSPGVTYTVKVNQGEVRFTP